MPDIRSVNAQVKLVSCEQDGDVIQAQFADNSGLVIYGGADSFFDETQWSDMLKKMLILDWLQEQVIGKTAIMDCATADDVWVKAEI